MKIAIISDIHSNIEALHAVLRKIDKEKVDAIVNLGDIVGYNASPDECVTEIRKCEAMSVSGNHDSAVHDLTARESFNVFANQAIRWSHFKLSKENKDFLKKLPLLSIVWDRFIACHGTLKSNDSYIVKPFQARRMFNIMRKEYQRINICFFGHTHRQAVWARDVRGKVRQLKLNENPIHLNPEEMYLINPGSVGQPRQNDWRASFLIFEPEEAKITFYSVPYDLYKAQQKILKAELPSFLAERLAEGV